MASRYAVVSLPLSALESSDKDDAVSSISSAISPDIGSVSHFNVPDFKIGTLDALVEQADDLAKLEATCQAVVAKVGESLKSILNNDEERLAAYKMVNDSKYLAEVRPQPCLHCHDIDMCLIVKSQRTSICATSPGTRFDTEAISHSAS